MIPKSFAVLVAGLALAASAWADTFRFAAPESMSGVKGGMCDTTVDCTSVPSAGTSISVSGLPSGVTYSLLDVGTTKRILITGYLPKKDQIYWVTLKGKNAAGYSHSAVFPFVVGTPADPGSDTIGLAQKIVPEGVSTGERVDYALADLLQPGGTAVEDIKSITVTGLPTGLSFRKNADDLGKSRVEGYLTKPGKFTSKISLVLLSGEKRAATEVRVVKDAGCLKVLVGCASGSENGGQVSKTGVYQVGNGKVPLSAKPAKDYVFAGWYRDAGMEDILPTSAANCDYRKPSVSLPLVEDPEYGAPDRVYGRFVPKSADMSVGLSFSALNLSGETWTVRASPAVTDCYAFLGINVSSLSLPTVTVKGLPPGCTFDKNRNQLVFAKAPQKPGTYPVAITAKNVSGATTTKTLTVVVPNLRSSLIVLGGGVDATEFYENVYAANLGGEHEPPPAIGPYLYLAPGSKVTASGLPPGIKLATGEEYAYFDGAPTKAGTYTVMLTIKNGTRTEKASFSLRVDPLPEELLGTYNGLLWNTVGENGYFGSFQVTVAASAKVSVKISHRGKIYSGSAMPCTLNRTAGTFAFHVDAKGWSCFCTVDYAHGTIHPVEEGDNLVVVGEGDAAAKLDMEGWKNLCDKGTPEGDVAAKFAKLGALKAYAAIYGIQTEIWGVGTDAVPPGAMANLTVTVKANGTATLAGKVDGLAVSATTALRFDAGKAYVDAQVFVKGTNIYLHIPLLPDMPADKTIQGGAYTVYPTTN